MANALMESIDDMLADLHQKRAEATTEMGSAGGPTSHPSKSVDDGSQAATDESSEFFQDKKKELKSQNPDGVPSQSEAKEGETDQKFKDNNVKQNPIGGNPSLENGTQSRPTADGDTSHPASVNFGDKYASADLEPLMKKANAVNREILEVINILGGESSNTNSASKTDQKTASDELSPEQEEELHDFYNHLAIQTVKTAAMRAVQAADLVADAYLKAANEKKGSPANPKMAAEDSESSSGKASEEESDDESDSEEPPKPKKPPESSADPGQPPTQPPADPQAGLAGLGGEQSASPGMPSEEEIAEIEAALAGGEDIQAGDALASLLGGVGGEAGAGEMPPPEEEPGMGGEQEAGDDEIMAAILEQLAAEGGGGGMDPSMMGGQAPAPPEAGMQVQASAQKTASAPTNKTQQATKKGSKKGSLRHALAYATELAEKNMH